MWSIQTKAGNTEYHEYYRDPLTNKRKTATITLKGKDTKQKQKLAAEELAKIIAEKERASACVDLTLAELKEKYITYQQKTVKKATWMRNNFSLTICVEQIGPDVRVNRLTAGYIRDRLLERTNDATTINEYICRIKAMLRWAYNSDYTDNITVVNKLKRLKDDRLVVSSMRPQDKYLEPDQLTKLLAYMETSQEYWYLLSCFLVLSGLRIGEALALESSDISDSEIMVNKTFDLFNREISTPKTPCSNRKVFVQKELAEVIKKIRIYNRNKSLLLGIRTTHFFFKNDGDYISYKAYSKYIAETSERVLGFRRTPHSFRHTHASLLFAEGVSLDTISRRLGHENSKITRDIYLHIVEKVYAKDREILSEKRLIS